MLKSEGKGQSSQPGELVFFCGKMGAGKSTKAKSLAEKKNGVLISEDEWLAAHFPDKINTISDYVKYSALIKPFMKSHVLKILAAGTNVIMDFPANTPDQRDWFKRLILDGGCDHELYYIDLPDDQCLSQIADRRLQQPERARFDTEEVFHMVGKFFVEPSSDEQFNIVHLCSSDQRV